MKTRTKAILHFLLLWPAFVFISVIMWVAKMVDMYELVLERRKDEEAEKILTKHHK